MAKIEKLERFMLADYKKLVASIRCILLCEDQSFSVSMADLARQYYDACAVLNQRLGECVKLVNDKKYAEAVKYLPSLLPMVRLLRFRDKEKWLRLCALYKLPIPSPIDINCYNILKEVFKKTLVLDDCVQHYQNMWEKSGVAEQVELLRVITNLEGAGSIWLADLRGLETERLAELYAEAQSAIDKNDTVALEFIFDEMMTASWQIEPDPEIVNRISQHLNEGQTCPQNSQSEYLLERLEQAYLKMRLNDVVDLLVDLEKFCQTSGYTLTAQKQGRVNEIKAWYEKNCQDETKIDDFYKLMEEFKELLVSGHNFQRLQLCYNRLRVLDISIPPELTARYQQFMEEFQLQARRRFMLKTFTICSLLILTFCGFFYYIQQENHKRRLDNWLQQVDKSLTLKQPEKILLMAKSIEANDRRLFLEPKVQERIATARQLKKKLDLRAETFSRILLQLKSMHNSGEVLSEYYSQSIGAAEALIDNDEQTRNLQLYKGLIAKAQAEESRKRDQLCQQCINKLNKIFDKLISLNIEANLTEAEKLVQSFEDLADSTLSDAKCSGKLLKTKKSWLVGRRSKIRQLFEEARQRSLEKKRLLNKISTFYDRPDEYQKSIKVFVDTFPEDDRSEDFVQLLNLLPLIEAGNALKDFNPDYLSPEKIKSYREQIQRLRNNIWADELGQYLDYVESFQKHAKQVRKNLLEVAAAPGMQMFEFSVKLEDGRLLKFYSKVPPHRKFSMINERKIYSYKIEALQQKGKNQVWHVKQKLSGQFDLFVEENGKLKKYAKSVNVLLDNSDFMPKHALFWQKMLSEMALVKEHGLSAFLLKSVADLQKEKSLNVMLKVEMIRILCENLKTVSASRNARFYNSQVVAIDQFLQSRFPNGADWRWLSDNDKKSIKQKLGELADFSRFQVKNELESEMEKKSLGRMVRIGGWFNDGKIQLKPAIAPQELWSLIFHDGKPGFVVVATVVKGKLIIDQKWRKKLIDGQPLLVPLAGSRTTVQLSSLYKRWAEKEKITINWPGCWPINCR